MQSDRKTTLWLRRASVGLCAVVMSHFGSCSSTDSINTIVDGVQSLISQLDNRDRHDEDISFGDWLVDELSDL